MIKVLAVDDEAPIRQWLKFCISKSEDFQCITASSAVEGIELFQKEQPDMVLSDIEMPGGSGLDMLWRLQQMEPTLYSVILTSHEDFQYARTALKLGTAEYMLKTEMNEENLLKVLEKAGGEIRRRKGNSPSDLILREHFLQAIAFGKVEEPITAPLLARYGIPLEEGRLFAVDCWIDTPDKAEGEAMLALPQFSKGVFFSLAADHTCFLGSLAPSGGLTEETVIGQWGELLNSRKQVKSCGISDIADSVERVREAIEQARRRCTLGYYFPQRRLFYREPIPPEALVGETLFRIEYMRALLDQEFSQARECIRGFAQQVIETRPADISSVKRAFLSYTISFLHFAASTPEEANTQEQLKKKEFMESNSFEVLLQAMEQVFHKFLRHRDGWGMTAPIRKAIDYMEQHYDEKIALSQIAREAAFSPEHFSRLFAKETGVTFVAYLNNLRMKNAVRLLETTNDKVYEIAEKVGFSSLSYFSTSFKKKFGQNPYEYQISHQKQQM